MGVIARPLPIRPIPWRLITVAALLVLLAAAAIVYVGSRRVVPAAVRARRQRRVADRNGRRRHRHGRPGHRPHGADHRRLDLRRWPVLLPRRTALRLQSGDVRDRHGDRAVHRHADGSDAHELFPAGTDVGWFEWSPTDDRALITPTVDGKGTIVLVNLADGSRDKGPDSDSTSRPRPGGRTTTNSS